MKRIFQDVTGISPRDIDVHFVLSTRRACQSLYDELQKREESEMASSPIARPVSPPVPKPKRKLNHKRATKRIVPVSNKASEWIPSSPTETDASSSIYQPDTEIIAYNRLRSSTRRKRTRLHNISNLDLYWSKHWTVGLKSRSSGPPPYVLNPEYLAGNKTFLKRNIN